MADKNRRLGAWQQIIGFYSDSVKRSPISIADELGYRSRRVCVCVRVREPSLHRRLSIVPLYWPGTWIFAAYEREWCALVWCCCYCRCRRRHHWVLNRPNEGWNSLYYMFTQKASTGQYGNAYKPVISFNLSTEHMTFNAKTWFDWSGHFDGLSAHHTVCVRNVFSSPHQMRKIWDWAMGSNRPIIWILSFSTGFHQNFPKIELYLVDISFLCSVSFSTPLHLTANFSTSLEGNF